MMVGAIIATAAIFTGLALGDAQAGAAAALLAQPALISVPAAFLVMIGVLRYPASQSRTPARRIGNHWPMNSFTSYEQACADTAGTSPSASTSPPRSAIAIHAIRHRLTDSQAKVQAEVEQSKAG